MNATRNGISANTRAKVISLIQPRLVDSIDLYTQMKQAHWNVRRRSFIALHELFDRIAGDVLGQADMMAERITALGGQADGTVRIAAETSSLREYPTEKMGEAGHVNAVAEALAAFARGVRAAAKEAAEVGDDDTADLFTEVSRAIDKDLWLVEAHVDDRAAA
jgi:starvation-inducible DNA-binding protein